MSTTTNPGDPADLAARVLQESLLLYARHIREYTPEELLRAGLSMAEVQRAMAIHLAGALQELQTQAAKAPATVVKLRPVPNEPT
jgi:hypothetical protein